MNTQTITTQAAVRDAFWNAHPAYTRRGRTKQNDYNATIRSAFCEYVDHLQKCGDITEKLARRVTL